MDFDKSNFLKPLRGQEFIASKNVDYVNLGHKRIERGLSLVLMGTKSDPVLPEEL